MTFKLDDTKNTTEEKFSFFIKAIYNHTRPPASIQLTLFLEELHSCNNSVLQKAGLSLTRAIQNTNFSIMRTVTL